MALSGMRRRIALVIVACAWIAPAARAQALAPDASGEEIFRAACATCHGADGTGSPRSVVGFALPLPNGHEFPDFTDCATNTVEPLYHRALGDLMAKQPDMKAAVAFYLVYVAGVLWFAVRPALADGDWKTALLNGALFGFFAYATYDLTNLATLKSWSLKVSLIDMAWGAALSAAAASAGALAASLLGRA